MSSLLPFTITSPEVGFSSIFIHRTSVLFPAPLIPMIPYISPSSIVIETSFSASTLPSAVSNDLLTFFNSIKDNFPFSLIICL